MLSISSLNKTYRNGVRALADIRLNIDRGLFGLLGPNGAGKSSLMRTIATLQTPDSGSIEFDGIDVLSKPAALRAQLGYLPQEFGVYPRIPARDLLDHVAILKGVHDVRARHAQIDRLLHLTNLYDVRSRAVSTFSGGMKQRFGIAQALLGSPRLLIVDEPTAGLDPEERNRFHRLLSEVAEDRVVILSTHLVEDVSNLCPRMAVIARGHVVIEGTPSELIRRLDGRLWRRRIAKEELEPLARTSTVISAQMRNGALQVHVVSDAAPAEGFERVAPDLEDVYFSVLKNPA
jgi:ABC-2 type transport system ATP-binding protein